MSSDSFQQTVSAQHWSVNHAREFYSIDIWSEGYFDVNEQGHLVARPDRFTNIDLVEMSKQINKQGLSLPVLIRFPQILRARVEEIDTAFRHAVQHHNSQLTHVPCYPVKVNQQRTVIEEILKSNCEKIGLEVGSKTELLVALGLLDGQSSRLVCNGYKDRAYIRMALYAQSMGINVSIVIENPSELAVIRQESIRIGLTPELGLRLKLNSVAEGHWQNSGGRDAKFGLDTKDILYCLEKLSQWNCKNWLKLIHFHMGSQISNLNEFSLGLQEAMHVYGEIISSGFELQCIDVGGGLAIDYASRHDTSYFSRSYSIQQYADTVVALITEYCKQHHLAAPTVFTENGRAITAHHAMLITNIVKVRDHEHVDAETPLQRGNGCQELYVMGDELLKKLHLHDEEINQLKQAFENKLHEKFMWGEVGLQQRAWAEDVLEKSNASHQIINKDTMHLSPLVAEKYYCNFSIFQSMPDIWGLRQIFPVVPLARLHQRPTREVRLHDLTCDSDGQISQYAYNHHIHDYLTLHEISSEEEYLLGFFLLGAYQEVLGDMHNLFGDTHALNVEQGPDEQIQFTEVEIGDCVNELLASVHMEGQQILESCQRRLEQTNTMNVTSEEILEEIKNALYGYTYLDSIDRPAHRIKR